MNKYHGKIHQHKRQLRHRYQARVVTDGCASTTRPYDSDTEGLPSKELAMILARTMAPQGTDLSAIETTFLFRRTAKEIIAAFDAHFAEFGISEGKFYILMSYYFHELQGGGDPPPTLSEIAKIHCVNRSTITGLMDGLEQAGLILRAPHSSDRRCLHIALTQKGRELMNRIIPIHFHRAAGLMEHLSPLQRTNLIEIFGAIDAGLMDFWKGDEKKGLR